MSFGPIQNLPYTHLGAIMFKWEFQIICDSHISCDAEGKYGFMPCAGY
jgi:hypothetical protein